MENLWAPWRGEFIHAEKRADCIFCTFPAEDRDPDNLILGRTEKSIAILNKFPYNNGHLMVIPRRHVSAMGELPEPEFMDLHKLLQKGIEVLQGVYKPQGFNVGMNLGKVAGAGIADHLHYHIVPRWGGDSNFMPVLAETKVMVEHLAASYDKLRPEFDRVLKG